MSQLKVNSIVPSGGLPAGASGGGIIQCVQVTKTDTDSTSSTSYVDVTGMSATITPQSSSSKILVQVVIGVFGNSTQLRGSVWRLLRGATAIGLGDNAVGGQCTFAMCESDASYMGGSRQYSIVDSPATTSAVTYKLQWATWSNTVYLNRSSDGGSTQHWNQRGASSLILMEVTG
jgi:hypothetical protein